MIKKTVRIFEKYKTWLVFMLIWNLMFGIFLWLMDAQVFFYIFPTLILGSAVLWGVMGFWIYRRDKWKEKTFQDFLENPDINQEDITAVGGSEGERKVIQNIVRKLQEKEDIISRQTSNIQEYEEYIEKWAHEIKTPLSLMTFILDNRREELSPEIYSRLEYVRTGIQEDIEKMLYYARLKSAHTDYFFTPLSLAEISGEVVEEYRILLEEMGIKVINEAENIPVLSDKRGLLFILRQILSNSIKYMNKQEEDSVIRIITAVNEDGKNIVLTIRDNGTGIKPYDMPFIFDKGFTGDMGQQRKNSTGMGLYLAHQIADNLKIKLSVSEEYREGAEISLQFPQVKENTR